MSGRQFCFFSVQMAGSGSSGSSGRSGGLGGGSEGREGGLWLVVGIRNNRRTRRGAEYDTYLSKSEITLASSRHSAVRRPSTLRSRYYYYNKPHYDCTDSLTGKFPSPAGVSDSDRPHGLQGSDCTKSRLRGHKSASQATKNGKEAKNKKKRMESWNQSWNSVRNIPAPACTRYEARVSFFVWHHQLRFRVVPLPTKLMEYE